MAEVAVPATDWLTLPGEALTSTRSGVIAGVVQVTCASPSAVPSAATPVGRRSAGSTGQSAIVTSAAAEPSFSEACCAVTVIV